MFFVQLLHNSNYFFFLMINYWICFPTCGPKYLMVNLKTKLLELYKSCVRIVQALQKTLILATWLQYPVL
jgi:hypothetical protein